NVFEIKNNKFVQIRNKVEHLSRDETNTMFYEMRNDKKYGKYYTKITITRQIQITNRIDTNFSKD
ncbi:MAG: hypothetical protein KGL95_06155, partial [Patescibacteria group bacterium]|nr:hypothetical protein [Patescibacteria group bacterium]